MSKNPITVVVGSFDSEAAARDAFGQVKHAKHEVGLHNVALVSRDGDKIHLHESKDWGGGKGAIVGGVIAGITTGGLSIVGGALLGGLIAKVWDRGLDNKELRELGHAMPSGFAVLAVVDAPHAGAVAETFRDGGAVATTTDLDESTSARLLEAAAQVDAEG